MACTRRCAAECFGSGIECPVTVLPVYEVCRVPLQWALSSLLETAARAEVCQVALHGHHMVLVQCKAVCSPHSTEGTCGLPVRGCVLHPLWIRELDLLPQWGHHAGGV